MCWMRMVAEGLPLSRREHGVYHDIIAGADSFSKIMDPPAMRRDNQETTPYLPSTTFPTPNHIASANVGNHILNTNFRDSRNANLATKRHIKTPSELGAKIIPESEININNNNNNNRKRAHKHSNNKIFSEDGTIISVRVSSSVRNSLDNQIEQAFRNAPIEDTTVFKTTTDDYTTTQPESSRQRFVIVSEERPSLIAAVSKSELTVEEHEPITSISDISTDDYTREYSAHVQPLPSPKIRANGEDFLSQNLEKETPFHHQTVIFHNDPKDPERARSVSYSAVVQAITHQKVTKPWEVATESANERQDRHYEPKEGNRENRFEKLDKSKERRLEEESQNYSEPEHRPSEQGSAAETSHFFATHKYEGSLVGSTESNWEKSEESIPNKGSSEPTERNWGVPEINYEKVEKPYPAPLSTISVTSRTTPNFPVVYGRPEQNYEVDEAVSVMSNGKAHGLQPSQPRSKDVQFGQRYSPSFEMKVGHMPQKPTDNQKFGYVVEGRNYRKYRVEERTSDGFIVGEYGVVSHNDGSLRGVRYTADETTNPRLIYDALMKFLSL